MISATFQTHAAFLALLHSKSQNYLLTDRSLRCIIDVTFRKGRDQNDYGLHYDDEYVHVPLILTVLSVS